MYFGECPEAASAREQGSQATSLESGIACAAPAGDDCESTPAAGGGAEPPRTGSDPASASGPAQGFAPNPEAPVSVTDSKRPVAAADKDASGDDDSDSEDNSPATGSVLTAAAATKQPAAEASEPGTPVTASASLDQGEKEAPAPRRLYRSTLAARADDHSQHLSPLRPDQDPTALDTTALSLAAGVTLMACTELLEPGVARRVYLAVTPFTVIAVAAHPTELGQGSLVWERSLAQLSFATVQALGGEMAVPVAMPREGVGRGFAGAIAARLRGRPRALEADSQAAEAAAAAAAPGAVGVLLAFAGETATSSVLLRVSRAAAGGAAAGLRSGRLQKRPAGLAARDWRQRHCWVGRSGLSYAAKEGGRCKGTIPLHGSWVDIAPTAVASADEDCDRDLTVRTPTSFHEFRAASAEDRDLWLSALRARASMAASELPASLTLVCGSQQDAERLAAAIESHRDALTLAPLEGLHEAMQAVDDRGAAAPVPTSPDDDASLALALQLQLSGTHPPERQGAPAGESKTQPAAASSGPEGASASWPAYDPEQPLAWSFIDDFGREQGPFPDKQMREWLGAGYFGPDTLVLCRSTGVPGIEEAGQIPSESLAAAAAAGAIPGQLTAPTAHLPLFALFPDPSEAFCGGLGWVETFNSTMRFQALLSRAADLGVDPASAASAAAALRERGEPASMESLLDMIHAQRSPERRKPMAESVAPPVLELPAARE